MMPLRINRQSLVSIPGIVSSVFPTLVCPGCWPAYTAFLSALGLPFIPSGAYLFPATLVFLAIPVTALTLEWRRSHRSGPFLLGGVASAAVLGGRFLFAIQAAAYVGAAVLVVASVWNSVPRRTLSPVLCQNCARKQ
jgi:hypothetical protein